VAEAFRRHEACSLVLEDGRAGTIVLTSLGGMIQFDGTGPLGGAVSDDRQVDQSE
jgi:hypothetical protein